ncbi:alcohol dehydrogenase catalytic domain-containing protein [Hoyosella altamirensis]|uniref:Alcohol dehydrogenase n=1 Tax=Hoyosella altamirensis TaxID=616997 RepID=A0A839RPF2_9ACTN|nr:alcohol dehydrogenase catalytic domain-containing protein [Hoyosella altamirensis]MBB3038068.1 alcohol dehydrogenase [Hoyosella altamirensis]
MKSRSAVLSNMGQSRPFAETAPLQILDVDVDSPGQGEVLVQIEAAGVCHSDLSVLTGQRPRPMPMAIGHEAAGRVVEVGPDVPGIRPGDHVVLAFMPHCGTCVNCAAGRTTLCIPGGQSNREGALLGGHHRLTVGGQRINHHLGVSAFSEYAVVHHSSAVVIDDDVPFEIAAVFGCAMLTGAGAVLNTAEVQPGESVCVIGLGGVGLAAVLGAVLAGATPIVAIDPVESKRQLAVELGATHACHPRDAASLIGSLTRDGTRWAIEAAGVVPAMEQAFSLVGRGGAVVSVGLPAPDAQLTLPAVAFVADAKSFIGSYMGSCQPQRDIPRMIAWWRQGFLPVEKLVDGTYPLSAVNRAMDRLAEGTAVRQILLPQTQETE